MGSHHRRIYQELADVDLVAVVDVDSRVLASARAAGIVGFDSLTRMIDEAAPDIASVAVPTELHAEISSELIARSVAVLIEKPLTSDLASARLLVEQAAAAGVTIGVGHTERFNPAVEALVQLIQKGRVGRVEKVTTRRIGPFPERGVTTGVVFDLASHDLDLVRSLLPENPPVWLEAEAVYPRDGDRRDSVRCQLGLSGGALWSLEVSRVAPVKVRSLELSTSTGEFVCDLVAQSLTWRSGVSVVDQRRIESIDVIGAEPLRAELEDFVSAVREKRDPRVSGQDALEAVRLSELIVDSAETGGRIEIS